MRNRFSTLLLLVLVIGVSPARCENDDETEARNVVLGVAGAFANDGFKVRDGHWSGVIKPQEQQVVAVNLYAGNQYWFSIGATDKAKKVTVTVYDETGRQVATDSYSDGAKAAASFAPPNSGQYYISVGLAEGDPSTFCLVYSYK